MIKFFWILFLIATFNVNGQLTKADRISLDGMYYFENVYSPIPEQIQQKKIKYFKITTEKFEVNGKDTIIDSFAAEEGWIEFLTHHFLLNGQLKCILSTLTDGAMFYKEDTLSTYLFNEKNQMTYKKDFLSLESQETFNRYDTSFLSPLGFSERHYIYSGTSIEDRFRSSRYIKPESNGIKDSTIITYLNKRGLDSLVTDVYFRSAKDIKKSAKKNRIKTPNRRGKLVLKRRLNVFKLKPYKKEFYYFNSKGQLLQKLVRNFADIDRVEVNYFYNPEGTLKEIQRKAFYSNKIKCSTESFVYYYH